MASVSGAASASAGVHASQCESGQSARSLSEDSVARGQHDRGKVKFGVLVADHLEQGVVGAVGTRANEVPSVRPSECHGEEGSVVARDDDVVAFPDQVGVGLPAGLYLLGRRARAPAEVLYVNEV